MKKYESVYRDTEGMSGLLKTRAGDKVNYYISGNDQAASILLLLEGELVAHQVRTEDGQPPFIILALAAPFNEIHDYIWPDEPITEQHALIIDALCELIHDCHRVLPDDFTPPPTETLH